MSYIFTGHSHRKGLYTFTDKMNKGIPLLKSGSILTRMYDFNEQEKFFAHLESFPAVIASNSIGPIPRANYNGEFCGNGSQYPSGTKVRFHGGTG